MEYYISNAMGDAEDRPDLARMRQFLDALDETDEEHAAAWLEDEVGNSLEYSIDGVLIFSRKEQAPRHMTGVLRERTLQLWAQLAAGRVSEIEDEPWQTGARPSLSPEDAALREHELAESQLREDRMFYDSLGRERTDEPCRKETCRRGRISQSIFCRVHHFERIRGRPCPFDE